MWTVAKSGDDYSRRFPQWWERDVDALVAKDFNHPSVIMYSIGNEIIEAGTPHGTRLGRRSPTAYARRTPPAWSPTRCRACTSPATRSPR